MLHIDSIVLNEFQGMWLNKIKLFKLEDIKRYQLILGRNGCGKSRLMRILSLIAPSTTDFDTGGYRTLTVTRDSLQYELHCLRVKSGYKCTITNLTDNEVLYDSVNQTVYNTAIKEIFNFDKDVHELITGKVLFTNMKTPERKKWFSILSESDLTYALSFYKKSREHLRDFTGAIKTIKHNIGILQPKVIENKDVLEDTRIRIDEMQRDIQALDHAIDTAGADWSITDSSLDANDAKLESISKEVLNTDIYVDSITKQYTQAEVMYKLAGLETAHNLRMSELSELIKKVERGAKIKNIDLSKLETMQAELHEQIRVNTDAVTEFPLLLECDSETLSGALAMVGYFTPAINNALLELNQDVEHDKVNGWVYTYNFQLTEAAKALNTTRNEIAIKMERVKNIDHVCTVDCNKCGHTFKPGIKVNEREHLLSDIASKETYCTEYEEIIKTAEEMYAIYNGIKCAIVKAHETMQACSENEAAVFLFKRLMDECAFETRKPHLSSLVERFAVELEIAIDRCRIQTRLDRVVVDAEIIRANQSEDFTALNERVDSLHIEVGKITEEQLYWKSICSLIERTSARMSRLDELDLQLQASLEERDQIASVLERNIRVSILSEERTDIWNLLITTKQRFEDMDRERQRLEDLEHDLENTLKRKDAANDIVNAMSPDGGILAKYLYQSITKVTDLMTGYVNSIWGYEMGIQPCKVSGSELDYMFPFYANDRTQITKDVSMGSTAQKEVINFVFMLSVYQAMKLNGFPLYLDELGSGFDEGHKPSMIDFVKGLIDRAHHSQVFMVSHDPETHFQLSHADVCVIDSNGITLPAVYNKNVTIQY